jgi:hypothetical protein
MENGMLASKSIRGQQSPKHLVREQSLKTCLHREMKLEPIRSGPLCNLISD